MRLIGSRSRRGRAEKLGPTPDEEYEVLTDEELQLRSQIRDLEGFIDEAPEVREKRKQETQVTLPPPEAETIVPETVVAIDEQESEEEGEDLQERLGRRHLEALKRDRRKNFYIFLISAAAVAAFLYWVSLVVQ